MAGVQVVLKLGIMQDADSCGYFQGLNYKAVILKLYGIVMRVANL